MIFKKLNDKPSLLEAPIVPHPLNNLEILLSTIVIALARLDLTKWIQRLNLMHSSNEVTQILYAIDRREHLSTWDGIIPTLLGLNRGTKLLERRISDQPYTIQCLIHFFIHVCTEDKSLDYSYHGIGIKTLRTVTNQLIEYEPEERVKCLEAIMDGLEGLATIADHQGDSENSMKLAQTSKIIMQFLTDDVDGAEDRLARAELQNYSWLSLSPKVTLEKYSVLNYMTYTSSATIAELGFFSKSRQLVADEQASNHLWTALWGVLGRQRNLMKISHAICLQADTWDENEVTNFVSILKNNLQLYLNCLKQFTDAIKGALKDNEPPPGYFHIFSSIQEENERMFLLRETESGLKLWESLSTYGLSSVSRAALRELAAVLEDN